MLTNIFPKPTFFFPFFFSFFLPLFFLLFRVSLAINLSFSVRDVKPIFNIGKIVATNLDGFIECKIYALSGLAIDNTPCHQMLYEYAFIFVLRRRFEEIMGTGDILAEIFLELHEGKIKTFFPFPISRVISDNELISLGLSSQEIEDRTKKIYVFTLKLKKNFFIDHNALLREVKKIVSSAGIGVNRGEAGVSGRSTGSNSEKIGSRVGDDMVEERMIRDFISTVIPELKL